MSLLCDPDGNQRLTRVLQLEKDGRVVTGWQQQFQPPHFTLTRTENGWATDLPQTAANATSDLLVVVCFSGAGVYACVMHRAERAYFRFFDVGIVTDMGHELAQRAIANYEQALREGSSTLPLSDVPSGVEDMLDEACKRIIAVRLYK
jgi:hypothetical protein